MSTIKDGGPAFPFEEKDGNGRHYNSHPGMSLRDYFAANATSDDVESARFAGESTDSIEVICRVRFRFADAMLAAREVQP